MASQAIPIVVLAPLFVLAFDYGIGPKLAIVALICFFPITVNVLDGLRSVDPELLKLMRSFGASRLQTLRKVELPGLPPVLLQRAARGRHGVGDRRRVRRVGRRRPRPRAGSCCWATTSSRRRGCTRAVVILTLMAVALFALVTLVERLATPWNRKESPA